MSIVATNLQTSTEVWIYM